MRQRKMALPLVLLVVLAFVSSFGSCTNSNVPAQPRRRQRRQ